MQPRERERDGEYEVKKKKSRVLDDKVRKSCKHLMGVQTESYGWSRGNI